MEGVVAIYGSEALYYDYVVAVIPSLRKDSRGNGRQQESSKRKAKNGFDEILESEKRNYQTGINITTVGYTRDARIVRTTYQMHEYADPVEI